MSDRAARYVISLLAPDHVGIIKLITSAVADRGGDIDGMSQTVIHGYFTVILTASFEEACEAEEVREAIAARFGPGEASIMVRPFELTPATGAVSGNERYVMTLTGKDRPGILKTVTTYLADNSINIEDYYFTIQGESVTHIGEITIPRELDVKQLQGELQTLLSSMGLVATLQHENLFRATNDIFSIRELFEAEKCDE